MSETSVWQPYAQALSQLEAAGQRRRRRTVAPPLGVRPVVDGVPVLAFCSNDYLGLGQHAAIAEAVRLATYSHGTGSGAAHLISGHSDLHELLEQELASFVGLPAALCFSTGYMANLGVVTALADRDSCIFADRLNHASLNDAMVLSRATLKRYRHNDMQALETLLQQSSCRRRLIISDSVFSMDGDIAPVEELLELAERYDALLILDDAHGFGVLGPQGRGIAAHAGLRSERLIVVGTLGKAAGVSGAFVAGSSVLVDWLLNHARTYIYTTASPPLLAAGLLRSLQLIAEGQALREHLQHLQQVLREGCAGLPWTLLPSTTPIQPLQVGESQAALDLSRLLLERGIWVPAIRPPTVPAGSARLRISLSAAHSVQDVQQLTTALQAIAAAGH